MDKAKNEIILATLDQHGGSTTFQVIMDVAEERHCECAHHCISRRALCASCLGSVLALTRACVPAACAPPR